MKNSFRYFKTSPEIIRLAVMMYIRFPLSFRRQERAKAKFRRAKLLQKFAATHASVHNHFHQERHLYSRQDFKVNRSAALDEWWQLAA